MKRGGFVIAVSFAWAVGMVPACGGESIVIGGEPRSSDPGLSGTAGETGGSAPAGGASSETGGSTAGTPVAGGTPATGGVGVGGANGTFASGGSSSPTGSVSTGTQTGGASGSAGEGGFNPYPYVTWRGGEGYHSCPRYREPWGFTCWSSESVETRLCSPERDPVCGLCSCTVPCVDGLACPQGLWGHPAECIESATSAPSCFLVCDDAQCPSGMVCSAHPDAGRSVCMWLAEQDPT